MRIISFVIFTFLSLSFVAKKPSYTFLAIGDGYTKGIGVEKEQRWTNLIVQEFEKQNIKFKMVGNLADSAYTVKDAIRFHIGDIEAQQANIITIMLGSTEAMHEMSSEEFKSDYSKLLTLTLAQVASHNSLLLITIPDFTATPMGRQLTRGFDARQKIIDFNNIIIQLAKEQNIKVFDIFDQSDQLGKNEALLAKNGVFPSSYGHQAWAEMLFPEIEYLINIPLAKDLKKKYRKD
jgi:lysophospholipase L1-like esterase